MGNWNKSAIVFASSPRATISRTIGQIVNYDQPSDSPILWGRARLARARSPHRSSCIPRTQSNRGRLFSLSSASCGLKKKTCRAATLSITACLPAFPLDPPFPIPIALSPLSQIDCMCSRELRGAQDGRGDAQRVWSSSRDSIDWNCNKYYTEMRFILCTWLREVCSCCFLTALPGPAWVLLNYVLQRILLISVCTQFS